MEIFICYIYTSNINSVLISTPTLFFFVAVSTWNIKIIQFNEAGVTFSANDDDGDFCALVLRDEMNENFVTIIDGFVRFQSAYKY